MRQQCNDRYIVELTCPLLSVGFRDIGLLFVRLAPVFDQAFTLSFIGAVGSVFGYLLNDVRVDLGTKKETVTTQFKLVIQFSILRR